MNDSKFALFTRFAPCPELQNEWSFKTLVITKEELLIDPVFFAGWRKRTQWTSEEEANIEADKYKENDRKIRKAVEQLIAEDRLGSWGNVTALTGELYRGEDFDWREELREERGVKGRKG